MSLERRFDQLHLPPQRRPAGVEPSQGGPEAEVAVGERQLARALARLAGDEAKLLSFLRGLPRRERLAARLMLTGAVGGARAAALCGEAFGPGEASFPLVPS